MHYPNLAGIIAIACWSITVAFARSVSDYIGPITTAMLVNFSGGIFGLALFIWKQKKDKKTPNLRYLFICGSLFITYTILIFLALGLVTTKPEVGSIGLINYLWVPLTIIFTAIILKKPYRAFMYIGLILALAGAILSSANTYNFNSIQINTSSFSSILPYVLATIAAVSWALYSTLANKWGQETDGAVAFFMLATAAVSIVIYKFINEQHIWNNQVVLELLVMAFATNIGYYMWDVAMRKGNIQLITVLSYSIPITSSLVTVIHLKISWNIYIFLGAFMIFAGAIIIHLSTPKTPNNV